MAIDVKQTLLQMVKEDRVIPVYLEIHNKGIERGSAGSKVVYNDSTVQVLVSVGMPYKDIVQVSYDKLHSVWSEGDLVARVKNHLGNEFDDQVIVEALHEVSESLGRSRDAEPQANDDAESTWGPLVIDGYTIPGVVEHLANKALYIDGLKLGSRVIKEPENGYYTVKSKPKTIIKNLIKTWLPIGLYTRFWLDPERLFDMKVGNEALMTARNAGIIK